MNQREKRLRSPLTLIILGILLFIQGIGLSILGGIALARVEFLSQNLWYNLGINIANILRSAGFFALGILGILSSIGFGYVWAHAWLSAMLLEALCMIVSLDLYFREKPLYAYIMMIYCIIMVIYLNYSEIVTTFRAKQVSKL